MSLPFPEPGRELSDPGELFLRYLDFYRSVVKAKLEGLSDAQLRTRQLPSQWSPLELLVHLVHMEQRWLRWGFLAEQVPRPWGDEGPDGRWAAPEGVPVEEWLRRLGEGARRTRAIVESRGLDELGAVGGRFTTEADRATLGWILFHVLQEYARHAGHLDVARELIDGAVGE